MNGIHPRQNYLTLQIPKIMKLFKLLLLSLLFTGFSYAQVGIGNTNPDPSSMLDIQSESQGLLVPRMTTAQRNAIASPAESLLVFDTDEDAFYYYDTAGSRWVKLLNNSVERDNYKLVKSTADLSDEFDGTKYTLQPNFLYEINGQINLQGSIDLNGAYVAGRNANEDILFRASGDVFAGSTGGSIKNVTISGGISSANGRAFNINGPGTPTSSLLIQNTIIANKAEVGTISGLGLFFGNIVQFVGNTDGITYTDIDKLLLNNQAWLGNNGGVYETLTGDFNLIQKISGFSQVIGATAAVDVTGITNITGDAVMRSVVFSGGGNYINGNSPYTGYNFTNDWIVECPGIPTENDDVATGTIYIQRNSTSNNPIFNINGASAIDGTTDSSNLFRMSDTANSLNDNVLQYNGNKTRTFNVNGSLSYQSTESSGNSSTHAFYLRRYDSSGNSISVPLGTEVYEEVNNTDVRAIPISGTIMLNPGDYIRVFGQLISGNRSQVRAYSLSLTLN